MGDDNEPKAGSASQTGHSRRAVLRAVGAATGVAAVGTSGVGSASATGVLDALSEQSEECQQGWLTAPENYPHVDVRASEADAQNLPADPTEVMVYAVGWDAEGQAGYNQAYTLAQALAEQGYDHPVIAAEWASNSYNVYEVMHNAERGGRRLAAWLQEYATANPNTTIRLSGLSMGARVPLVTLTALDGAVAVETVSLFGNTVANEDVCTNGDLDTRAIERTAGRVYNYHSENDSTTCSLFPVATLDEGLGCGGVDCERVFTEGSPPDNWVDVDVTDNIDGHCQYQQPETGVVDRVVADIRSTPEDATGGGTDGEDGSGQGGDDHGEWGQDDESDHGWWHDDGDDDQWGWGD